MSQPPFNQPPNQPPYNQPPQGQPNPYASPLAQGVPPGGSQPPSGKMGKVLAPAICLLITSILGMGAGLFNVVFAMVGEAPPPDPNLPDWLNDAQQNNIGTFAAILHTCFFLLNLVILIGSIQMIRMKSWVLALIASILAIINFGSCCCILGLPFGIWSLVILNLSDVKRAFK